MVLPLTQGEHDLPPGVRGTIYAVALVYFFVGVAMISDRFMSSIETVTSRRKRVYSKEDGRRVTLKVWNDTVATLSLMALGSSAPEIALAVVDIFKWKFHFAPLGAATIVGSAAFNQLVIISVCIAVIPAGEGRQIEELPAFHITAAFSLFAYLWLAFILTCTSPNVVEIWEAVLTFAFLPTLIWVSYKVDVGDARRLLVRLGLASPDSSTPAGDDNDGSYFIMDESLEVQGCLEDKTIDVEVTRSGLLEVTRCSYATERFSAVPDFDFGEQSGTLEFSENVDRQTIRLEIKGRPEYKVDREFLLILSEASGSTVFNPETDGGEETAILTVMIRRHGDTGGKKPRKVLKRLDRLVNINSIRHGNSEWMEQFCSAMYCKGSKELQQEATLADWVSHILALPWTMLFTLVPPTSYCGGWVCFFASLAFIAGLTIFISDLAELFGCVLGVPDYVTAITFVALGTSMPDLFASLSAAREDPTADASIVNVTGSNSVNVFLGLGLPWTIAAFYWRFAGKTDDWTERYPDIAADRDTAALVVSSQDLSFCVAVFAVTGVFSLGLLYVRRHWIGFELGGPPVAKYATSVTFLMLWFAFVGVASWSVLRGEESSPQESMLVPGLSGLAGFVAVLVTAVVIYASGGSQECKGSGVTSYEEKDVFATIPVAAIDEKDARPTLVRAVSAGSSNSKKSNGNTNMAEVAI